MRRLYPIALGCLLVVAPAYAAGRATPVVPKGNPGLWVTTDDYPLSALREEGQGVVRFVLDVDASGVPVGCSVSQSSGRADLDDAACRLITERARFEPAKDRKGKPIAGTYSNSVRWQIPRGHPVPPPGELVTTYVVEKDGTVSSCTVESAKGAFEAARSQMCDNVGTFDSISDADGKPVRKRIRTTMKVEQEDLP
jgi:protein TonB